MKNHLTEAQLLQLALQQLEGTEREAAEQHLQTCSQCIEAYSVIQLDVERLSSLRLDLPQLEIPLPSRRVVPWKSWLKVAALLAMGFFSGYGVSQKVRQPAVCVVPQIARQAPPPPAALDFVVCESVELATNSH